MSADDILAILVIVLCLAGSMFFSGAETVITSFGDRRARRLKEEGGREGRIVTNWVDRPVFVLSTILLGNNIVNTLLGATATAMLLRKLEGGKYSDYAVPAAVLVSTGLLLVFGEIVPKAMGRIYSRRLTVPVLLVLNGLGKATYPLTWVLSWITEKLIQRAVEGGGNQPLTRITTGELDYLVRVGQQEGSIPEQQAAMLKGVFRIEEKTARDIMVPVDKVTAVDLQWDMDRVRSVALRSGHSRLPVYAGDIDNVKGILHIKDFMRLGEEDGPTTLREVLRPPLWVPESTRIQDLLRRFKERRVHLGVVVDDSGDTVGVVTLEDVLEQIVGQIFDETDRVPSRSDRGKEEGTHVFEGTDSLAHVEERFGVDLEEFDGVDSIGDLLTQLAGQIPVAGSVFVFENLRIKVLAADARHIIRVKGELIEREDEQATGS